MDTAETVQKYGFIYVLMSDAMPGCYKVGMTCRSPHQRAHELSRGTGVPNEYEVVFYAEVENPRQSETAIHAFLDEHRKNKSREFFTCPLGIILNGIINGLDICACYESDIAIEAMNPGRVFPNSPLFFETNLHDIGYLQRVRQGGAA